MRTQLVTRVRIKTLKKLVWSILFCLSLELAAKDALDHSSQRSLLHNQQSIVDSSAPGNSLLTL